MPFFKTAMFPTGESSNGENITHFTAVRMRLQGEGNLDMTLYSTDDVRNEPLVALVMAATTNIQPTRLSNFNEQRASLNVSTDEIDEWFRIHRLMIFVKEFGTSYPG